MDTPRESRTNEVKRGGEMKISRENGEKQEKRKKRRKQLTISKPPVSHGDVKRRRSGKWRFPPVAYLHGTGINRFLVFGVLER